MKSSILSKQQNTPQPANYKLQPATCKLASPQWLTTFIFSPTNVFQTLFVNLGRHINIQQEQAWMAVVVFKLFVNVDVIFLILNKWVKTHIWVVHKQTFQWIVPNSVKYDRNVAQNWFGEELCPKKLNSSRLLPVCTLFQ